MLVRRWRARRWVLISTAIVACVHVRNDFADLSALIMLGPCEAYPGLRHQRMVLLVETLLAMADFAQPLL